MVQTEMLAKHFCAIVEATFELTHFILHILWQLSIKEVEQRKQKKVDILNSYFYENGEKLTFLR